MSFNLISKLTAEDRVKIENYIKEYGTRQGFIGIDEWLKYWGTDKIKLYKLLGNQFIYTIPFEYNKTEAELTNQFKELLYPSHDEDSFKDHLYSWIDANDYFSIEQEKKLWHFIDCYCLCIRCLNKDKTDDSFKLGFEGVKKTLQLQEGMKPIRAISRLLNYCKGIPEIKDTDKIISEFEQFRIAHSMILNDKIVKGKLSISIHPLDFMTMSDNNSNWHSCMAWTTPTGGGCYHAGTVEMMNSNNVLCCYLENKDPFYFKKGDESEEYTWNNKRWRQLVYITKDIIVTGKSYPFASEEISKTLVETIRALAKKNLNWDYTFGPELYQDMKHITGYYSMDRAKGYISKKMMTKHNILFDTKGMYNDMLNDSYTKYWCVRNKVKHNLVISYSGKVPCLRCGKSVISQWPYAEDYNERYDNVGQVLCKDCLQDFKCSICYSENPVIKYYTLFNEEGEERCVCQKCIDDFFRICPDCGKPFYLSTWSYDDCEYSENAYINNYIKREDNPDFVEAYPSGNPIGKKFTGIRPICRCNACAEKDSRFSIYAYTHEGKYPWMSWTSTFYLSKQIEDPSNWEKYFPENLQPVTELADGEVVTC